MPHPRMPFLKKIALFAPLPEASLRAIAEVAGLQRFSNHAYLFREGEEPDFVYCFVEGGVVLVGSGADAQKRSSSSSVPAKAFCCPRRCWDFPIWSARAPHPTVRRF